MIFRRPLVNVISFLAPTAAPKLGSDIHDPVQMYLSDIYTIAVNLAGLPALTLPAGFSANGLPIGVQFIGNYFSEAKIFGCRTSSSAEQRLAH